MIRSVLVVCVGNICRSPAGERLLQTLAPQLAVTSAGLGALVGQPASATMVEMAAAQGLDLHGHAARQFTPALGQAADLILVMEPGHKARITRDAPHLSGKTMLFDHWSGASGIADPYQRSVDFHRAVFGQIETAATAWAERLNPKASA
jgi:protein-tyrosine phosphatase